MSQQFYKVYIACMTKDAGGFLTKDYMLAKQLYRKLEQKGIHTFLTEKCNPADRTEAIDSAVVLIVTGTSAATLLSDTVRNDYEDFIAGVELSGKRNWRVFSYLRGITRDDLPDYLMSHRSYDHFHTDELVQKIEKTLRAEKPKYCMSDDDHPLEQESLEDWPESLPDSAESLRECANDDDDGDDDDYIPARRPGKARRAPELSADEVRIEDESEPDGSTMKVRPAKINKVDFSVVAPDEVKPGKSSVIVLLMYTRSQRSIVKRTIALAKEKSSEAARSSTSVKVKQGSKVTAQLFSDDIEIPDDSRTMIWNGDALDFKFRVTPPEDYAGKEIDFGCSVRFEGIEITRLYFTVAVGSFRPQGLPQGVRLLLPQGQDACGGAASCHSGSRAQAALLDGQPQHDRRRYVAKRHCLRYQERRRISAFLVGQRQGFLRGAQGMGICPQAGKENQTQKERHALHFTGAAGQSFRLPAAGRTERPSFRRSLFRQQH